MKPRSTITADVQIDAQCVKDRLPGFGIWSRAKRWWDRKPHVLYGIALTLAPFASTGRSTTVVVIWTPAGIIVAADSRVTDVDSRKLPDVCKIKREGRLYYSVAGLYEFGLTRFYVPDIVHRVYSQSSDGSLFEIAISIETEIADGLFLARDAASEALRRNPNLNIGEFIVLGFDGGSPKAMYNQVDISNGLRRVAPNGVRTRSFEGLEATLPGDNPRGVEMVALGLKDHIFRYQVLHPEWKDLEPGLAARMFVQMEIDAHPDVVGPPIAVVMLPNAGPARVIERGVCPQ